MSRHDGPPADRVGRAWGLVRAARWRNPDDEWALAALIDAEVELEGVPGCRPIPPTPAETALTLAELVEAACAELAGVDDETAAQAAGFLGEALRLVRR